MEKTFAIIGMAALVAALGFLMLPRRPNRRWAGRFIFASAAAGCIAITYIIAAH